MSTLAENVQISTRAERQPRSPQAAPSSELIVGDARKELARFPDGHFQCCVTSPPYWGLRDYGIDQQIGAEGELGAYV